jgi:hypothetical protein
MLVYHTTPKPYAILSKGFKDGTDYYLTRTLHTGVWFADVPLDENEGARGETTLCLVIPPKVFARAEEPWVEEGKPYREALIRAAVVNRYGPAKIAYHRYADCSREFLVKRLAAWRKQIRLPGGERLVGLAAELRRAIRFLDKFGWGEGPHWLAKNKRPRD